MACFLKIYCAIVCWYLETGICMAVFMESADNFCETSVTKIMTIRSVSYFKLQSQEDTCGFNWAESNSACRFFVGGTLAAPDDDTIEEMEGAGIIQDCFWISAKATGRVPALYWFQEGIKGELLNSRRWDSSNNVFSMDCCYICPQSWQIEVRTCFNTQTSLLCSKVEISKRISTSPTITALSTALTHLTTSTTLAVNDLPTTAPPVPSTKMAPTTTSELSTITTVSAKTSATEPEKDNRATPATEPKEDNPATPATEPKKDDVASLRIFHGVRHVGGFPRPRLKANADFALTASDVYACIRNCKGSCNAVNYGSSEGTCLIFYDFATAEKHGAVSEFGWSLWTVRNMN